MTETILRIIDTHRRRDDFHRSEKSMTLRIHSILRRYARQRLSEEAKQALRDGKPAKVKSAALQAIKSESDAAYASLERFYAKGEQPEHEIARLCVGVYDELFTARASLRSKRKAAEKELEKLAMELPVWPWVERTPGIGALGLGQIVGEAGDLRGYSNPAKLWKRMGLGMADHGNGYEIQRRWKDKQKAMEAGYNPNRRSVMFRIGDSFVKQTASPYREVYLERKQYEVAKAEAEGREVLPSAKVTKGRDRETYRTVGHIAKRAQRYAEKRLLLHLWMEWKRCA